MHAIVVGNVDDVVSKHFCDRAGGCGVVSVELSEGHFEWGKKEGASFTRHKMGVGFFRKLKEGIGKAWKWIKEKAVPTVKKVWQVAKPILKTVAPMIPTVGPVVQKVLPTVEKIMGGGGGVNAVRNTTSPFIKLKKNTIGGGRSDGLPPYQADAYSDADDPLAAL